MKKKLCRCGIEISGRKSRMYCDTCKLIAKREACARFYERQKNGEAPPKKRKPKVEKTKRYFEKCMDCGCSLHSETEKRCSWCRDKKKGKSKKIDQKWLVRGNITYSVGVSSIQGGWV